MVPPLVPADADELPLPALLVLCAGTARGEGARDGDQPGGRGQPPEGGSSAELKIFEGGCALHCHSLPVLPAFSETLGVVNES